MCKSWTLHLPRSLFVVGLLFAATGVISCSIVNCVCSLSVDFMYCVDVTVDANQVYVDFFKRKMERIWVRILCMGSYDRALRDLSNENVFSFRSVLMYEWKY